MVGKGWHETHKRNIDIYKYKIIDIFYLIPKLVKSFRSAVSLSLEGFLHLFTDHIEYLLKVLPDQYLSNSMFSVSFFLILKELSLSFFSNFPFSGGISSNHKDKL